MTFTVSLTQFHNTIETKLPSYNTRINMPTTAKIDTFEGTVVLFLWATKPLGDQYLPLSATSLQCFYLFSQPSHPTTRWLAHVTDLTHSRKPELTFFSKVNKLFSRKYGECFMLVLTETLVSGRTNRFYEIKVYKHY